MTKRKWVNLTIEKFEVKKSNEKVKKPTIFGEPRDASVIVRRRSRRRGGPGNVGEEGDPATEERESEKAASAGGRLLKSALCT